MADLYHWDELEKTERWRTLLLGNGMSINVSSRFDYSSLYDEAKRRNLLDSGDEAMFELFSTKNFEVALSKLRDAIVIAEAFEENTESYKACFRSIQDTLGHAVQKVHLKGREVPAENLAAIQDALLPHRRIFTTSYDLLAYWAIGHGRGYQLFCDCFWGGNRNEFDPDDCAVRRGSRPIYYLHGALHLVVSGDDTTWKLTRKDLKMGEKEILDRFYKPVPGDPEARPLLVTEGSSRDKMQAIEANDYLSHAYRALREDDYPLLVFGHSLEDQDQHLIEAIKATERPVAISMVAKNEWDVEEQQARIKKKLKMRDVFFYDAATHPLGASSLRVSQRKRKRPPRKVTWRNLARRG